MPDAPVGILNAFEEGGHGGLRSALGLDQRSKRLTTNDAVAVPQQREQQCGEMGEALVGANLAGHDSHGVIRIPAYINQIKAGGLTPSARPSIVEETALMFVEYDGEGKQLPPRFFTVKGNVAHVDALVIKFEQDFVKKGDPLRGHSLVLFHRLYGDYQAPADGFVIDTPGKPPEVYRIPTRTPAASEFESQLWQDFWKLADDEGYRKEKGVKVAMGEGPWTRFYPDKVYTLTLQADGGLSLSSRAMDGIWKEYRDALAKARATAGAN